MSAGKPWPLGVRDETQEPDGPFGGLALSLEILESQGDVWWGIQELDRSDADAAPVLDAMEPTVARLAAETIDRFGYEHARGVVAAIVRGEEADEEHDAVITNVECRFGTRGLLRFAGLLAGHCAGHEQWRRRSA